MQNHIKIAHTKNFLTALVQHTVRIKTMFCLERFHRLGSSVVDDVDFPSLFGKTRSGCASKEAVSARQ